MSQFKSVFLDSRKVLGTAARWLPFPYTDGNLPIFSEYPSSILLVYTNLSTLQLLSTNKKQNLTLYYIPFPLFPRLSPSFFPPSRYIQPMPQPALTLFGWNQTEAISSKYLGTFFMKSFLYLHFASNLSVPHSTFQFNTVTRESKTTKVKWMAMGYL